MAGTTPCLPSPLQGHTHTNMCWAVSSPHTSCTSCISSSTVLSNRPEGDQTPISFCCHLSVAAPKTLTNIQGITCPHQMSSCASTQTGSICAVVKPQPPIQTFRGQTFHVPVKHPGQHRLTSSSCSSSLPPCQQRRPRPGRLPRWRALRLPPPPPLLLLHPGRLRRVRP